MHFFVTFQAERERDVVVDHLADIDRVVDESLTMLGRYQELNNKVLPLMEDYLIALRSVITNSLSQFSEENKCVFNKRTIKVCVSCCD